MANQRKKKQVETQKAKALPRGRPSHSIKPTNTGIKLTISRKGSKANSENTPVEPVPPRPRPRPAYKGAKAGLVTTPGPSEQETDVQAAALLLDLAGHGNAGQLGAIEVEAVGNKDEVEEDFKASDGEDDEIEEVESAANSPRDFGEFITIC
jgi:hypothetical protein